MNKLAIALAVVAMAGLGVTAASATTTRTLRADPNGGLRFNTTRITARHGVVKLVMANPRGSGLKHGIAIAGHGRGRIVGPGHSSTVTARLRRGTYTFYCPVSGHRAAGMRGKLIVR